MPDNSNELRPVAFMVMPFRKRAVPSPPDGAPAQIDCDALWDRAFRPALEKLGYLAIRADIEVGSVIIKDMLERLALAELVVADLTLPNGNVYYEVGLRHAAKRTHCILIAADWSRQLFDTDQIRTERYPLKDGMVPEDEAELIQQRLLQVIHAKKDSLTPYFELVKDKTESTVFREQIEKISRFQAEVRSIRMMPDKDTRAGKVAQLRDQYTGASLDLPEVAFELLTLVRDCLGWEALVDYVDSLPQALQQNPFTKEQVLLAKSEMGDHLLAIAGLEELIKLQGENPERHGLIGGRYKRLWRAARSARQETGGGLPGLEEQGYLDSAIEHYTRGTALDLNAYYCPSNLPALLRTRGNPGDEEEAAYLDKHIVKACERTIEREEDDGWARPTLLGAAFRNGDVQRVKRLALEVVREGAAVWQLKSTLDDIHDTVEAVQDAGLKAALAGVRDQLAQLL
jgi:tetratricopeptide (TPR) repeat protein